MNKNLLNYNEIDELFINFDKNKKEKPKPIKGEPAILVFLYQKGELQYLADIKMCDTDQINKRVTDIKNTREFTHYAIKICKNRKQQEKIFLSILVRYPHRVKSLQGKKLLEWKATEWTKKYFNISKKDLNKICEKEQNILLHYNGSIYWHIPTITKLIKEVEKP